MQGVKSSILHLTTCTIRIHSIQSERKMTMTKSKNTTKEVVPVAPSKSSIEIKVVDELGGYVTPKLAAQMLGLELASMSAIIHAGKVDSVKISGVVLIEKAS